MNSKNVLPIEELPSPLGPLAAFTGVWCGSGFNTIFRPNSQVTPTILPVAPPIIAPPASPVSLPDNILELNITSEILTFGTSVNSVPNRGSLPDQGDIFLNGVAYTQAINDVTTPGELIPVHFEPGLWLFVPPTANPPEPGPTVVRMASIPHGTTIQAQGIFATFSGPPQIPPVDITPFVTGSNPPQLVSFTSQSAANPSTFRLPQTLPPTITQAMLDDPNSVLRTAIATQNILSTTVLSVSTLAAPPMAGGGANNIQFLGGSNATATSQASGPNAQAIQMTATFWIETVQNADCSTFQQIQYSQTVFLNFNGLIWPHVSVATLTQKS